MLTHTGFDCIVTWLALPRATQTIDLANGKKNDKIQACAAQF